MKLQVFLSELRLYLSNYLINSLPSHRLRRWFYGFVMKFTLDPTSAILLGTTFYAPHGLIVGANSVIGRRCRVDTRGQVRIGRNVSISDEVVILTADHDLRSKSFESRERPVHIGDHAFVGTRATILPACSIGEGAALAAGSILTTDIPDHEIWGGCPARRLGERPRGLCYETRYQRPLN